jgi:seryl-tRNA synthetase
MIDIQLLRKDPELVAKRLLARGAAAFDAAKFRDLESRRKQIQTLVEQAQAGRNKLAKEIGQAKAKGSDATELLSQAETSKSMLEASEQELAKLQAELQDFLARIPNIPHESVPQGTSADDNAEQRRWGEPKSFAFPPKDHVEIGEGLGGALG